MRKIIRLVAAVAAGAAALTACGGNDDEAGGPFGPSGTSGLMGALGQVRDTESTRAYFEYGNIATISDLTGGTFAREFAGISAVGTGPLATRTKELPDAVGFDVYDTERAFFAGQAPKVVGRFSGTFDTKTIEAKLEDKDGTRKDAPGGAIFTWGRDGEISLDDNPWLDLGMVNQFNNIYVSPDSFGYGSSGETLSWITDPGTDTLAQNTEHRELAACLGPDITAAILLRAKSEPVQGVGVAMHGEEGTEVWCVRPDDPEEAAGTIKDTLTNGRDLAANRAWNELVTDVTAEARGDLVRVTVKPAGDRPAGIFFRAIHNRDLDAILDPSVMCRGRNLPPSACPTN